MAVARFEGDSEALARFEGDALVDLDGFLSNLVMGSKFIHVAYNGVAGDAELQIKMRDLGFELAELCDESSLTASKFQMTAESILTDLSDAYKFFLDGMEEMSFASFESVKDSAKQMADAASKLCDRFNIEKERVLRACRLMTRQGAAEGTTLKDFDTQEKALQAKFEKLRKEQLFRAEEEKKLQEEIETITAEEAKMSENLASNAADLVLGVVTLGILPIYRLSKATKAKEGIQDKIDRLRQNKRSHIKCQQQTLREMEECAEQIAQCRHQKLNIPGQVIPALRCVARVLSSLATIMQNASGFWKSVHQRCGQKMNSEDLEVLLEVVKRYENPTSRFETYKSTIVKTCAKKEVESWMAMETACNIFAKRIKDTREEIYGHLCKNPTIEESQAYIHRFCEDIRDHTSKGITQMERKMKQMEE